MTSMRPLTSPKKKNDRGSGKTDRSNVPLINQWHFQWVTPPQEPMDKFPHKPMGKPEVMSNHKADRVEKLTSPMWHCLVLINTHVWKYLAHHT